MKGPTYNALMNNHLESEQLFHIGVKWLMGNSHGRYLCVKSSEWFFDLPGGRIKPGEDWTYTLWRELREELCLPSDAYSVADRFIALPTDRFTRLSPEKIQLFLLICPCTIFLDDTTILLNEENTEFSWETARDLYEKVTILQSIPFETIFE